MGLPLVRKFFREIPRLRQKIRARVGILEKTSLARQL